MNPVFVLMQNNSREPKPNRHRQKVVTPSKRKDKLLHSIFSSQCGRQNCKLVTVHFYLFFNHIELIIQCAFCSLDQLEANNMEQNVCIFILWWSGKKMSNLVVDCVVLAENAAMLPRLLANAFLPFAFFFFFNSSNEIRQFDQTCLKQTGSG